MSLQFVKWLYNPQAHLPNDKDFFRNALQDIEQDGISSQIYYLLKQQGRLEQMPFFFQKQLKDSYEKDLFQNLFIKNQTDHILKMFEEKGIDVIPLKGVYFAEKFFSHLGARATSDIDLLIKLEDLERAISSIKSLGFSTDEEQIPGHFHCSYSKPLPNSTIPLKVELHWSLVKASTSKFNIDDLWCQALPLGSSSHIKELSPNHTFYMICLHGWRHNLDSMKYFLDIIQVMYIYRNNIDYEEIFTLAKRHQTTKRLIRTLSIVYQQFPELDYLLKFPYHKRKTFWNYHSSRSIKQYVDFIDYQFFSFDTLKHSLVEFFNMTIPSKYKDTTKVNNNKKGPKNELPV